MKENYLWKEHFEFRNILTEEADQACSIEQICFPPNEACSPDSMVKRVIAAPELFLTAVDQRNGKIAGFLNGIATDEEKFRDEFFTDISLHRPEGKNVMLLGLDVLPQYRRQGLAREIVSRYAKKAQTAGKKALYLTCLADKIEMYLKFGFTDLGISASVWGGEEWHDMVMHL